MRNCEHNVDHSTDIHTCCADNCCLRDLKRKALTQERDYLKKELGKIKRNRIETTKQPIEINGDYNVVEVKQIIEIDGQLLETFWDRIKWVLTGKI
jgi:hypothetical protein